MICKKLSPTLLLWLATLHSGMSAWAAETGPRVLAKHEISGGIHLSVSPQGQKYFEQHLTQILGNIGTDFSEGHFDEAQVISKNTVNLDQLEKTYPEPVQLVKQVRKMLTQWLVGFSLKDHRPAFKMGPSDYAAEINRMAVLTDQALMDQLGRPDGAVLVIELEIKKIVATTDYVKIWDANNPQLGEIGLKNLMLTLNGQKTPLYVRLPFYVSLDPKDALKFEVLSVTHNLNKTPIEVKYQSLIVPQLLVTLNGVQYPLSNAQLEKTLGEQMPTALNKMREYITEFAHTGLPQKLNELAMVHLQSPIEQAQHLTPPGRDKPAGSDRNDDFLWGLKLKSLKLQKNLYIGFNAYAEDPLSRRDTPLLPALGSRGEPNFVSETTPHDLAMAIDRAVINRILELSYLRGYFEKISAGSAGSLTLRGTPSVDYVARPAGVAANPFETFAKIHVAIETEPDSFFLEKTIVLELDIVVKIAQTTDGMEIVLHHIDLDTLQLDKKYLTLGPLFANRVISGIKDRLAKISLAWKNTKTVLPGKIDLPPPIWGQTMDVQKISFDPKGHLVMYLNFGAPVDTKGAPERKGL